MKEQEIWATGRNTHSMPWYLPVHHPLLWDELRRRLRGARGYWVLFGYGMVLVLILSCSSVFPWFNSSYAALNQDPKEWPDFGHTLWLAFLIGQMALICLVSPAITAGVISSEREKGTLELLCLSPISTLSLTLDKYFGAVGQLLMLVLCGLPVISVVFVYGGVSPLEVVLGYLVILLSGLYYAALGFLASCLFRRTVVATIWAYGFLIIALVGLPLLYWIIYLIDPSFSSDTCEVLLASNPLTFLVMYTSDKFGDLWQPLLVMALECSVVLAASVLVMLRVRRTRSLIPRRVSLAVARYNSRSTQQQ